MGELDTTRRRSSKVDGDKKKGGKKMKQSNNRSKSQSKSKQNNQEKDGNSDLDGIDITIPDYYKSNTAASLPQKQIEYSPDEWIEEGVLKSETQHSFFEKDTKEVSTSSAEKEDDAPTDKQTKIHTKFISALERHGSSERAFHNIAEELDWSIEDTKVYAYSYFKALIKTRSTKIYKGTGNSTNKETKETLTSTATANTDNWSFYEHILLDALMVKYCKDSSCLEEKGGSSKIWDRIAYKLPGRTAQQCKIEGIKRLQSYGDSQSSSLNRC